MASTLSASATTAQHHAAPSTVATSGHGPFDADASWVFLDDSKWFMRVKEGNGWGRWPIVEIMATTKTVISVIGLGSKRQNQWLLVANFRFRCVNEPVVVPPHSYERYVVLEPRPGGALQPSRAVAPGVGQGGPGRMTPHPVISADPSSRPQSRDSNARARGRRSHSVPPAERPPAPAPAGGRSVSVRSSSARPAGRTASTAGAPPRRGPLSIFSSLWCFKHSLGKRNRGPRFTV